MKNLFLIDGASGTGKSDLLLYVANFQKDVAFIQKYSTRSMREYEKEQGIMLDLKFITDNEFGNLNLDYCYNYYGRNYGFSRLDLDLSLQKKSNVFLVVRSADVISQLVRDYRYINVIPVYVYTDQEKLRERLHTQGYSKKSIEFRLDRISMAFEDYLRHPSIYKEILINNSTKADYHRLIDIMIDRYKTFPEIDPNLIFVLMSFNPKNPYLIDYYKAMQRAIGRFNASMRCINLDEVGGSFKISSEAKANIRNCRLAIVDLTENKQSVYYELGYVDGIGKDRIITAQADTSPYFYPNEYRILLYNSASELEDKLYREIKKIL